MKEEREKEKRGEGRKERNHILGRETSKCKCPVARESRMCYVSVMTFSVAGMWRRGTARCPLRLERLRHPVAHVKGEVYILRVV